jgi:hypothetical protein
MTITKDNFIVVYRKGDAESLELATYYASKHNMDTITNNPSAGGSGSLDGISWEVKGQMVGVECSDEEILGSEAEFGVQVLNPVKYALENTLELSDSNRDIYGIILGYNVPGGFYLGQSSPSSDPSYEFLNLNTSIVVSSTSRMSRINHDFDLGVRNKLYNRSIYKRFDSNDAIDSFICSRIDAPTLSLAKQYVDQGDTLNQQIEVGGMFYIDPYSDRADYYADEYKQSILDFQSNILPSLNLDTWSTTFLDPYIDVPIPFAKDDSFIWSWFTDRATSSFFSTNTSVRSFFYNADYDGALTIRDNEGTTWPILAMNGGYASCAGSMSNPTIEGFLNPNPFFISLLQGSTIGEAYLFSLPYLDWTVTLFGDPLSTIVFPLPPPDSTLVLLDEGVIEENASWYLMSVDLAKTAAELYAKEQEYEEIRNSVVDLQRDQRSAALAMLYASQLLYLNSEGEKRRGQLKTLVEGLFEYPQLRFRYFGLDQKFPTIDDYLTEKEIKVSRLLTEITGDTIISEDNLLDEGWWEFEFPLIDDGGTYKNYYFMLSVYSDPTYATFLFTKDSLDVRNWFYEKEKDTYVPLTTNGVSSSYIGRKIRYQSIYDDLLSINEYLTRGETYYFKLIQYTMDMVPYPEREFSLIIYT